MLRFVFGWTIAFCGVLWTSPALAAVPGSRVTVVVSDEGAALAAVLDGVHEAFATAPDLEVREVRLAGDAATGGAIPGAAVGSSVVLALGPLAADQARQRLRGRAAVVPLVSCLALKAEALRSDPSATGVVSEPDPGAVFALLQRVLPTVQTVGVMYSSEANTAAIEQAHVAAIEAGLGWVERRIARPQDIPAAMEGMADQVDALWSVADPVVYTDQTWRNILLFSFRSRIPVVGWSADQAEAGALLSTGLDYTDVGHQCGELTLRVARGEPVSALPVQAPRALPYVVNLRTADLLGTAIDEEVLGGAARVY